MDFTKCESNHMFYSLADDATDLSLFCSWSQGALRDQDKVDIAKKTRSYSTNLTDNSAYADGEEPMRTKIATLNCINRLVVFLYR